MDMHLTFPFKQETTKINIFVVFMFRNLFIIKMVKICKKATIDSKLKLNIFIIIYDLQLYPKMCNEFVQICSVKARWDRKKIPKCAIFVCQLVALTSVLPLCLLHKKRSTAISIFVQCDKVL